MISSTTVAASAMDTVFEYRAMGVGIDSSLLVAGNNTIAVEIHQVNVTSSDIIFDLQLRNI